MNYKELEAKLKLTDKYEAENFQALKKYCNEQIGEDISFEGDDKQQYQDYLNLVKIYLDTFLQKAEKNLLEACKELDGYSPLHYAAREGFDKFLTSCKNDYINDNTARGKMTPLHLSAVNGKVKCVEILLAKGADPNIINGVEQSALFSALTLPYLYPDDLPTRKAKIFNMLKKTQKVDLNHKDKSGDTLLHLLAMNNFEDTLEEMCKEHPNLALQCNERGEYPIHSAILQENFPAVKTLLENTKSSGIIDTHINTIIHYAAQYGELDILEECLKHSQDQINKQNNEGKTPIMLALREGKLDLADALLKKGAKIDKVDAYGYNILHHAILSDSVEAVKWVLENTKIDINSGKMSPLELSENHNYFDISQYLKGQGARSSSNHPGI